MRQYLRLGERRYLHQGLVLVYLERTQCGLGQHGLRGQHGVQLLQRQWLSRDYGKRGGRHHAWRCQKDVGPWPQVLWNDKRRGARRSWMSPMRPGPRLRSQGQARGMGVAAGPAGPPCICPRELWVCPSAPCIRIGLWPRSAMYWFSRKVPCAGPAGNMPGCAAAGFPMSSGLPVSSPIAAPRCTVVAGCSTGTGAGRGVALCWAARGDWDRVVAAAEGVVMFALPLDSLGRICGCFGWMSRGAPEAENTDGADDAVGSYDEAPQVDGQLFTDEEAGENPNEEPHAHVGAQSAGSYSELEQLPKPWTWCSVGSGLTQPSAGRQLRLLQRRRDESSRNVIDVVIGTVWDAYGLIDYILHRARERSRMLTALHEDRDLAEV
ncbi:hypothetical protein MRX96_014459 [Rhipicephalus microplus]